MSDKYFLDTNIFVYSFDGSQPQKRKRALGLIEEALSGQVGLISSQVVQEFLNVALQKFVQPMSPADASNYLDEVLLPLCQVFPSEALFHGALAVKLRWRYSFYDSLILAAALQSGTRFLYTEDFQHGQTVEHLRIVDPFRG